MKSVFTDTFYWLAIIHPKDPHKEAAKDAMKKVGQVRLVTTDEVLVEVLNTLSGYGEQLRQVAAGAVRAILDNPNVDVVHQSRQSFLEGLKFYESRKDKEYSVTDCISMTVMKSRAISEVLTSDHHFAQEGFVVLIKK